MSGHTQQLTAQMHVALNPQLTAQMHGLIMRGIRSVVIDSDGHLIFTLTDNSTVDLGRVVGDDGVSVVGASISDGHLYLTLSDGTLIDAGEIAGGDKHYVHRQNVPDDTWTIQHNLGKYPAVSVVDSAGTVVYGEVQYLDLNSLTVSFSGGFSGKAYLN